MRDIDADSSWPIFFVQCVLLYNKFLFGSDNEFNMHESFLFKNNKKNTDQQQLKPEEKKTSNFNDE